MEPCSVDPEFDNFSPHIGRKTSVCTRPLSHLSVASPVACPAFHCEQH